MEGKPLSSSCYSSLLKWRLEQNVNVRYKKTIFLSQPHVQLKNKMQELLVNNKFLKSFSQCPVDKLDHILILCFTVLSCSLTMDLRKIDTM